MEDNIRKMISSIAPYKNVSIKAHFVTVICFMQNAVYPSPYLVIEALQCEILREPQGQMRAIFFLPELGKTLGARYL